MGQDKKQLESLLSFVESVYDNPANKEFINGIRRLVKNDLDNGFNDPRIDEIYEMCIRRILREQAESAYEGFPLIEIKEDLISDFIKMERAHRENDIDEFGIRLYRQIECISRCLSKDEAISRVVSQMMDVPFLVESRDSKPSVERRQKEYKSGQAVKPIFDFVLIESKRSKPKTEKKNLPLREQYAMDMLRLIIYYVCFEGMLQSGGPFEMWITHTGICSDIYSVRNRVHGGNDCSEHDRMVYERMSNSKSQSFHRMLSFLFFFIDGIKKGFPISKELIAFAESV